MGDIFQNVQYCKVHVLVSQDMRQNVQVKAALFFLFILNTMFMFSQNLKIFINKIYLENICNF